MFLPVNAAIGLIFFGSAAKKAIFFIYEFF